MKRLVRPGFTPLFVLSLAAGLWAGCEPAATDGAETPRVATIASTGSASGSTVVVVVRHAERSDQLLPGDTPGESNAPGDPDLSRMGQERAQLVADLLVDADFDHVWSTDYQRTRLTATPTAEAAGLAIETYDPRDLAAFAATLTEMGGRHLVLGHSNTTPDLVASLGGTPGSPIEEQEYDRLYIVSISGDGLATTTLLRFGLPFTD